MTEEQVEDKETLKNEEKPTGSSFIKTWLHQGYYYLRGLMNLVDDSNPRMTMDNIEASIEFRGENVWILFLAIIIASIGLNVNSTAVIIGAMLISPLMSPIQGMGLAVGVNDFQLLRRSLRNWFTMVIISLLASSLYFLVTPLSDAQSELLSRTQPTIFDVLIAFTGGIAGIVAASRKVQKYSVVAGVAIATALMPPLCTAGYGIGTGQWHYFFGAFYLFFINSVFIALATFAVVRGLHFPRKTFLNAKRERKVKRILYSFAIIVLLPSIYTGYHMLRKTSFDDSAIRYINSIETNELFADVQIINVKRHYDKNQSSITLSIVGKPITPIQSEVLHKRLLTFGLEETQLIVKQAAAGTLDIGTQAKVLQGFIENKEAHIAHQDSTISQLRQELFDERAQAGVQSMQVTQELMTFYPQMTEMSFAITTKVNVLAMRLDTIPTVTIDWIEQPDSLALVQIQDWLTLRYQVDTIALINNMKEVEPN